MKDFFDLTNHGTDSRREALAGATTFVSAMYIVVVNPAILQATGMPYSAALTATVLVSAFASIMMGLYTNNPLVVAPGMSLNSLFALAVARSQGVDFSIALGCVFWAGVIFFLLMVLDRKRRIMEGVPRMLRLGMAGGIGLFIALLGLRSGGLILPHPEAGLTMAAFTPRSLTFLIGLFLTAVLVARHSPAGFLKGVALTTILAWPLGRWWGLDLAPEVRWQGWLAAPDFSLLFALDLVGAASLAHWPLILVILLSCMFDSMATMVGVAEAGDLVDHHGQPQGLKKGMVACGGGHHPGRPVGGEPAGALYRVFHRSAGRRTHRSHRGGGRAFVSAFSLSLPAALPDAGPGHRAGAGAGGGVHAQTPDLCALGAL